MSTIEKAAASTTVIQDHAGTALEALQSGFNGRIVNGYGIYVDPLGRRRDLLEARKVIDAALAVMGVTKWPTEAEYDLSEQA